MRNQFKILFSAAVLAIVTACAPGGDADVAAPKDLSAETVETLLEIDRKFNQTAQEQGFGAATIQFLDLKNGFLLEAAVAEPVRGEDNIYAQRNMGDIPSPVSWEPQGGVASRGGDFGITWGYYKVAEYEESPTASTGKYLTVWRKTDEGDWKAVTDMGLEDAIPAAAPSDDAIGEMSDEANDAEQPAVPPTDQ